ncbi:MAG: immunoglobulin domain-containing protein [Acidobacteria bacterium]|nr:immunoglobulin domain-containing protein [Acidobacteriota bacterium]MCB9398504.1 immunoglobulin domain-containing protein [Acidobacteriota bacterium]
MSCRSCWILFLGIGAWAQVQVFSEESQWREVARSAQFGEKVYVEGLDLMAGISGLELHRIQVWADGAQIVIHGPQGEVRQPHPNHHYYVGHMNGDLNSQAYLTIREDGRSYGWVAKAGHYWLLNGDQGSLQARLVPQAVAEQDRPFECLSDTLPEDRIEDPTAPDHARAQSVALGGSGSYNVTVAAESDFEYFQKFGNTTDAAAYMADLIGFASGTYADEVDANLLLGDVSLWTSSADPWVQTNELCALFEFGKYWNANNGAISRTTAHFFSGKPTGGGVAWIGVLCQAAFNTDSGGCLSPSSGLYGGGYGFSGDLDANFDINNPTVLWDIVEVSHEIGHNFNSPHTHCYKNLEGNANPIDMCNGSQMGANCYSGATSLPCGTVGGGCGTIMSYCHLLSGGMANISFTFGLGHPFGVAPERVPTRMNAHVISRAGANPGCIPMGCTNPSISQHPANQTKCPTQSVTFMVTASGATGYQWKKGNSNIGGATSSSYTIASVTPGDAGNYSCVVSNGCGSITSNSASLTVNTATSIGSQSGNLDLCPGQTANFSVTASGTSLTYQWRKGGMNIGGATNSTYQIASVTGGDAATYDCVVTGACGSATSAGIVLSVGSTVTINSGPDPLTRCTGTSATFSVSASNATSYQWRKNGVDLAGQTTSTLTLNPVGTGDAANYTCLVGNACGSQLSPSAALTVQTPPNITSDNGNLAACLNDSILFFVNATGTNPTYQWQKNTVDIGGATQATYMINSATLGDQGSYRCQIMGTCGNLTSTARTLTVSNESFQMQENLATTIQGVELLVLDANVVCGGPQLQIQWSNLTAGTVFPLNQNPVTLGDFLMEPTLFEVWADNGFSQLTDQVFVLAADNPLFYDLDGDGCNDFDDFLLLVTQWRASGAAFDANGDNQVDVRDFLYINTTLGCP